jgi:hypothetical protein
MTFVQNPGTGSPVFDYSSRDYVNILTDLLARQQVYLPEWTSQSNNDFGIVMLQEFAYACDILHYYIDRLGNEAFIQTATQPQSILNLASLIGYTPYLSSGATVQLQITVATNLPGGSYPVTIPAGTQFCTTGTAVQPPIVFTTTESVSIYGTDGATPWYVATVPAVQGVEYVSESVAVSNGSVNQAYVLQNNPVSGGMFTVYVNTNPSVGPQAWTFVETLVGQAPTALVYTNFVDANQNFYIVFGDGVNGYVPPLGSPITCTYFVNEGPLGNVGANTVNTYLNPPSGSPRVTGITGVTNPSAASGGAAQESIQSIQTQAPASLTTLGRGITVQDINTLAKNLSGFVWASAVEATYQLVNLYMAPNGGGALNSIQIAAAQTAMAAVVLPNTTVTILSPTYVPVDIQVNVVALPQFSNLATQQAVILNLSNYLALANTGFGFRVSLGEVYQIILQTLGVNYAAVEALTRETMVTLNTPLVNGTQYTALSVTQLPQALDTGDALQIGGGASIQNAVVSSVPPAGTFSIPINTITANANYAAGTSVRDTTLLTDVVFLPNEIPTVGVLTINVTGGTTP